jgi:hypothetical protein
MTPTSFALVLGLRSAAPESAEAEVASVGTLPLRLDGDLAPPDRAMLAERFHAGVERGGLDTEPVRAEGADTCEAAECRRALAAEAKVPYLVGATVAREGPDYVVTAWVASAETGEMVVEHRAVCEICGVQELAETIEGAGARLRARLDVAVAPTRMKVVTEPAGARVRIDGTDVGASPVEVPTAAGTHTIEIVRDGYRVEKTEADVRSGVTETFSFRLVRLPKTPQWLPWAAIGVGTGLLATGVALIAIDGREIERGCNPDPAGRCEFVHATLAGGITSGVLGVALIGTGIGLAVYQRRDRRVRASIDLRGRGLVLSGRF